MRFVCALAAVSLVACASAKNENALGTDATTAPDSALDAASHHPDAAPDARPLDAFVPDAFVPDACVPTAEICDGFDNDCDGHIDEGFDIGMACDGPDTDSCAEGVYVCDGLGGRSCTDHTTSTVELCNGLDDDCANGADDGFDLGAACTVGVGACARTGTKMCSTDHLTSVCDATAAAPGREICGNAVDEDCSGADAVCPTNDLPAGAIDISTGGTFTVDLTAAHDDDWHASIPDDPLHDCGDVGGRDAFYTFALPAEEVVYFDTLGSDFDSVIRVYAGACTSLGALAACVDDECHTTRSQGALDLAAGRYCLVVDQFKDATTEGAAVLTFARGGRAGTVIPAVSGSSDGNTTLHGATDQSVAGCEPNSHQPDVAYAFLSCPAATLTVGANLCTNTGFDAVLSLRAGAATTADVACSDDEPGCGDGLQPRFTGEAVTGAHLNWFVVDGFGTGTHGRGAFTLTYTFE